MYICTHIHISKYTNKSIEDSDRDYVFQGLRERINRFPFMSLAPKTSDEVGPRTCPLCQDGPAGNCFVGP